MDEGAGGGAATSGKLLAALLKQLDVAVAKLGESRSTARAWIKRGRPPPPNKPTRTKLYRAMADVKVREEGPWRSAKAHATAITQWLARPDNKRRIDAIEELACGELAAVESEPVVPTAQRPLDEYLEAVKRHIRNQPLALESGHRIERDAVYVKLRASDPRGPARLGDMAAGAGLPLEDYLAREHGYWSVRGEPGSGKTTLLLHVASARAEQALRANTALGPASIPVLVRVADLIKPDAGTGDLVAHAARAVRCSDAAQAALRAAAAEGRVLFLLDGLDEAHADPQQRALSGAPQAAVPDRRWIEKGCRVVVASRHNGYWSLTDDFIALDLVPLDRDDQRELLQRLAKARGEGPAVADRIADAIWSNHHLRALAGNPFLLTLMALIGLSQHQENKAAPIALPARRAEVLDRAITLLLRDAPRRDRGEVQRQRLPKEAWVRRLLEEIALALLKTGAGPYKRAVVIKKLVKCRSWRKVCGAAPWGDDAGRLLDEITHATGLGAQPTSVEPGVALDTWRFQHRALQERLAASALARPRRGEAAWKKRAKELGGDPGQLGQWAETFALLTGALPDANEALREIAKVNPDLAVRALGSAGDDAVSADTLLELVQLEKDRNNVKERGEVVLDIARRKSLGRNAVTVLRQIRRLACLKGSALHGADLYFVQEALEEIAGTTTDAKTATEAREEVGSLFDHLRERPIPDLSQEMVELPDGRRLPYWCEVTGADAPFGIGRVPVTNALYERFDPGHCTDREFSEKVASVELDHHPVVNVSWYEAVAFCRWLALRNPSVRLPQEAEWKHAATSGDGREFPWKSPAEPSAEHANYSWRVRRTTRVGTYTKGEGPFGTLDQSGNVYEWCGDTSAEAAEEGADRVYCGGSWRSDATGVRATSRNTYVPSYRDDFLGFRLARGETRQDSGAQHGPRSGPDRAEGRGTVAVSPRDAATPVARSSRRSR